MTYCDYSLYKEGARSFRITLPCFAGDDDFYLAVRMNRFYSSVMDKIFSYASSCIESNARRANFRCSYSIEEGEGKISITMNLSFHETGSKTIKKSVNHCWRRGHIISKSVIDY